MRIGRSSAARRALADWLDGFSVCASFACIVHCLVLPLLIAALPAIAGRINPGERFHLILLAVALPVSASVLIGGWRRHRGFVPLALGMAGLAMMAGGIAFTNHAAVETGMTVVGGLLLAGAHLANWRGRRCAERPHPAQ